MRVAVFDSHGFEIERFRTINAEFGHEITYFNCRLDDQSAALSEGFGAVCSFVNDCINASVIRSLSLQGVRLIALRSAGFNHVDIVAARDAEIPVVRVPEYSPYAVAEHAIGLVLALNRKIHRAYCRVRELNLSLEGMVGFDMHGKTVGVIGTGRIGQVFARICLGLGCEVLAHDLEPNAELQEVGVRYVGLEELYASADVLSLHVPLNPSTRHLIDAEAFSRVKPKVVLVNTGRGALIETRALIDALKMKRIGAAGLDVYEEEEGVFFQDLSCTGINDDLLARLLTFPNVLVTSHQGFLTEEALVNIARTTLSNISCFERGEPMKNQINL